MPRDGTQQYVLPFPDVEPNTTIESTVYNGFTHDVAIDLNTPRPISSGGTGANNAHDAMLALNGEIALQVVTNYDSFPFVSGSFYSAPGATSAPEATAVYGGICYVYGDPNFMALEARNLSIPSGPLWVRQKVAGVWQAWVQQVGAASDVDGRFVNVTGDTMTGTLTIQDGGLDVKSAAGEAAMQMHSIVGQANDFYAFKTIGGVAKPRWLMRYGDDTAESVADSGSNFNLYSYNDAGVPTVRFQIDRLTGLGTVAGDPTAPLGIATKRYADNLALATALAAAPFDALAYNGMQLNGACEVSQQYASLSSVTTTAYIMDGWVIQALGSAGIAAFQGGNSTFPGYGGYAAFGVNTPQGSLPAGDRFSIQPRIEGYRVSRLRWGTANAQPVTLGFWTCHHRTGIYYVGISNAGQSRSYVTAYTQNVADAAEWKTVTIPGDTAGTWNWGSGVGMYIDFAISAGANFVTATPNTWLAGYFIAGPGQVNGVGATTDGMRITGLIVLPGTEAPSVARAPYIMRPFDQELTLCKRYWEKSWDYGVAVGAGGYNGAFDHAWGPVSPNQMLVTVPLVTKRAAPSITTYDLAGNLNKCTKGSANNSAFTIYAVSQNRFEGYNSDGTNASEITLHWTADARL